MVSLAQGLNFLHTRIQCDPKLPSMDTYTAFHRDIKSANICLTSTFQAKLIDCGLGKLVAKDTTLLESISRSAQVQTGGGGAPLGTPAYRDPGYEHRDYDYGSYCDIFSFGVVMAEVFTGTLSGVTDSAATVGSSASDGRTIYRKYVHVTKKQRSLRLDVDDLISDASEESLNDLSSMSLHCMDDDIDTRPKASRLVSRLHDMIMRNRCGETWRSTYPPYVPAGGGVAIGERCHKLTTIGLSCLDHFICSEHLVI